MIKTVHFSAKFDNYHMIYHGDINVNISNKDSVIKQVKNLLVMKCKDWCIDSSMVNFIEIYYYEGNECIKIFEWEK
jgi:hypothetical protein